MNDFECLVCGNWIDVDPGAETAGPPICWDCDPDDPLVALVCDWWYETDTARAFELRNAISKERYRRELQASGKDVRHES